LKVAKSYADAGYFARNLRAIEVLVDQDVVRSGRAATEPWKFYDLGHGYCTYDFFEQCQHRMACAKCDFYMPKESTAAQLLEGRRTCCGCSKRSLLASLSRQPSKIVLLLMKTSYRNWPMCPLRQGQHSDRSVLNWYRSHLSDRHRRLRSLPLQR
jgi:hypothetical protein